MITLSLCMIVKNEEKVLGRILEQMKEIADEMIIVDTGSTDATRSIARQYTKHIFCYPWHDDFAAARNFACSKASMDYWMWLDADDVLTPANQIKLRSLKATLPADTDVVMMKYLTGFDAQGRVTFSYDRERLFKNDGSHIWQGRVHEAVTPSGKVLYLPIEIEHRKITAADTDRNLRIYEQMLASGTALEPRHQYYYGRELFYHGRYEEAISVFRAFLDEHDGWIENRIEACLQLARCWQMLKMPANAFEALFKSFLYDLPRAEICCEIGGLFLSQAAYHRAVYWYNRALQAQPAPGGFTERDCYDFIPTIGLCVCYDRLGERQKAHDCHRRCLALKPDDVSVLANERYFSQQSCDQSPSIDIQ